MFSVGIGFETVEEELRGIANEPHEKFVFNAESFEALKVIEEGLFTSICEAVAGKASHSFKIGKHKSC